MSPQIQGERKDQVRAKNQATKISFRTALDTSSGVMPAAAFV